MRNELLRVGWATLALAGLSYVGSARADARECAGSYEQAQKLRRAEKFGAARQQLLLCVQPSCPKFMVNDCSQWLGEVEQALSSVVLSARDGLGHDVTNVRVLLDGSPFAESLDGRAIQLDSGIHTFRFELEQRAPVEQQFVIRQGERNRLIAVQFQPTVEEAKTMSSTGTSAAASGSDLTVDARGPDTRRYIGYGLEGLGALGVGAFVFFGLSGRADRDRLQRDCAPGCAQTDVDAAKQKLVIGDISLALGLASAGIGTYLLLSGSSPSSTKVGIRPSATGAVAEVSGSFQ